MNTSTSYWLKKGIHNGMPIALGYLAVSFTLGIAAKNAGLTALQAALASYNLPRICWRIRRIHAYSRTRHIYRNSCHGAYNQCTILSYVVCIKPEAWQQNAFFSQTDHGTFCYWWNIWIMCICSWKA